MEIATDRPAPGRFTAEDTQIDDVKGEERNIRIGRSAEPAKRRV